MTPTPFQRKFKPKTALGGFTLKRLSPGIDALGGEQRWSPPHHMSLCATKHLHQHPNRYSWAGCVWPASNLIDLPLQVQVFRKAEATVTARIFLRHARTMPLSEHPLVLFPSTFATLGLLSQKGGGVIFVRRIWGCVYAGCSSPGLRGRFRTARAQRQLLR